MERCIAFFYHDGLVVVRRGGAGELCRAGDMVEEGGEEWSKGWCYVVVRGVQAVAGDAWAGDISLNWWVDGYGSALRGRGSTEV